MHKPIYILLLLVCVFFGCCATKLSFEGYGRKFDLRLENNKDKLFHRDLEIIVSNGNDTQTKLGIKDLDTSIYYGGYLDRERKTSEVTAHIDNGVLVAMIQTDEGACVVPTAGVCLSVPSRRRACCSNADCAAVASWQSEHGYIVFCCCFLFLFFLVFADVCLVSRGIMWRVACCIAGPYFLERADNYIENPTFSNILYRGSDMPENASEALHGAYEGKTYAT